MFSVRRLRSGVAGFRYTALISVDVISRGRGGHDLSVCGNIEKHPGMSNENYAPTNKVRKRSHSKKKGAPCSRFGASRETKKQKIAEKPHIASRNHFSNNRKIDLIAHFDKIRPEHTTQVAALRAFCVNNPSVPYRTMQGILRRRLSTEAACATGRTEGRATRSVQWLQKQQRGRFDAAENDLFVLFVEARLRGEQVVVMWFSAKMLEILKERKPAGWEAFTASEGWRQNFFERFNLVMRETTNIKTLTVAERLPAVFKFYKYFQSVCSRKPHVCEKYGRFPLDVRLHIDEVPFELGGVLSKTAEIRGAKRVHVAHPVFRIESRQASMMLNFGADGTIGTVAICLPRTPNSKGVQDKHFKTPHDLVDPRQPLTPAGRKEFAQLRAAYPNVLIYCQPKSYFDDRTFGAYMQDCLRALPKKPHVIIMDNAGGHVTDEVRRECAEKKVELVFTPANCTDICAVTDAGLGKSVKAIVKNKFRDHFRTHLSAWRDGDVTAQMRRQLATQWFSEAIEEFRISGRQQIVRAHQRCGSGLCCDGSENNLIGIEGYEGEIKV